MFLNGCIVFEEEKFYFNIKIVQFNLLLENSIMCVFEDVTQQITLNQQLQEMDQYKDKLLANITHDLKTPLNAINIYAELSL